MTINPIGAYKYFTESEVRSRLAEWNATNDLNLKEELDSLHLIELELSEVSKNLDCEYFYQSDDWAWYAEEFIDQATERPYPKKEKKFVLISDKNGATYKYFPGTDKKPELASMEDMTPSLKHPIDDAGFILVFFLHFYDPTKPLNTPAGKIKMPTPKKLPERLKWKEYTHWD